MHRIRHPLFDKVPSSTSCLCRVRFAADVCCRCSNFTRDVGAILKRCCTEVDISGALDFVSACADREMYESVLNNDGRWVCSMLLRLLRC